MSEMLRVSTDDGKYTCIQHGTGHVEWLRYDKPWMGVQEALEWAPPKAALALAYDLESTREERDRLKSELVKSHQANVASIRDHLNTLEKLAALSAYMGSAVSTVNAINRL